MKSIEDTKTSVASGLRLGAVSLMVSNLERVSEYWQRVVGLHVVDESTDRVGLGVEGDVLVELVSAAGAPIPEKNATGLFHVAVLLPTRTDLAIALRRLSQNKIQDLGASDHLVSEALYVSDPEGNGIEIYWDRPQSEWNWEGSSIEMATLRLDFDGLLNELDPLSTEEVMTRTAGGVPAGTKVGHVHLKVSNVSKSLEWYTNILGMDTTAVRGNEAGFMSVDGYHHHLGLNSWNSTNGNPSLPGTRGLSHFNITLPTIDQIHEIATAAESSSVEFSWINDSTLELIDPSGIRFRLACRVEG